MTIDIDKDGILDNTPLKFGKFKGKTPSHIAQHERNGESYLVWAYETVGNFDVCSETLYKDCGGKGKRAQRETPAQMYERQNRAAEDKHVRRTFTLPEERGFPPGDHDDDIPF